MQTTMRRHLQRANERMLSGFVLSCFSWITEAVQRKTLFELSAVPLFLFLYLSVFCALLLFCLKELSEIQEAAAVVAAFVRKISDF